ncbi:glypican-1-like isoform X3 [Varroa destructor]|uniref:Glypican-5 n=1 Tax=Varroa destructor TaxID=109461 RepID=A0A7M7KKW4_VARDE|nr:glypican-1-like isoform X3 [Varroa destructor]
MKKHAFVSVGADSGAIVVLLLTALTFRVSSASASTADATDTNESSTLPACNRTVRIVETTHSRANSLLIDFPFKDELRLSQAEAYSKALDDSREHTLYALHTDLKFFRHNDSVDLFYQKLRLYLIDPPAKTGEKLSKLHIGSAVQQLFSELFISVFHQLANPRLRSFSDEYSDCLRKQSSSIQPFGDGPQRLSAYFSKSFQAAHLLMKSTQYMSKILRMAANMNVTSNNGCARALARMFYCPTCRGLYDLHPCISFCLNVMRGCFAPWADLDPAWSSLVDKTTLLLKKSQETNCEVEHALLILPRRLIDAVQYAMDNGIEVVKRVRANCGDPQGPTGSAVSTSQRPSTIQQSSSPTNLLTGPAKKLEILTIGLQVKLGEIRDLLGIFSEFLCTPRGNSNCWTGVEKGNYRKSIAERGIIAQRLNSEVSLSDHQTPIYQSLDKYSAQMKRMSTEIANAGVMKIRPESNNYQGIETRQQEGGVHEGSGDLEGSGDFEGSGSGAGPDDDTEADHEQETNVAVMRSNFNASVPVTTDPSDPNSSPSRTNPSLVDVLLLATAIIVLRNYQ